MTVKEFLEAMFKMGINLDAKIYIKPDDVEHPFTDELTEKDELKNITVVSKAGRESKIYFER